MNRIIILMVLLALSMLVFGCTGKKAEQREESAGVGTGSANQEDGAAVNGKEQKSSDEELADLFSIDTNKPIEDQGYDVKTPSSD